MGAASAFVAGVMAVYAAGPVGFNRLCVETPHECRPAAETRNLSLEDAREVNRRVNASIQTIAEHVGADDWQVQPAVGDREDPAIAKRHILIGMGAGSANARIATGERAGENHAVVLLTLSGRTYVLDSVTDAVLPLERSDFTVTSVQSAFNPRIWLKPK